MTDKETLEWLDNVTLTSSVDNFKWNVIIVLRIIIKLLRDHDLLEDIEG